jgi:hypothetical protein
MTTKWYILVTAKLCCSEANNVLMENIINLISAGVWNGAFAVKSYE